MKNIHCTRSIASYITAVIALIYGMLPLATYAESTNSILVCMNQSEIGFIAEDFAFGLSSDPKILSSGASSANTEFSDVTIQKLSDSNSPGLLIDAAEGRYWEEIDILVFSEDTVPEAVSCPPNASMPATKLVVYLRNAVISQFSAESNSNNNLVERLAFAFGEMCISNDFGANLRCWNLGAGKQK